MSARDAADRPTPHSVQDSLPGASPTTDAKQSTTEVERTQFERTPDGPGFPPASAQPHSRLTFIRDRDFELLYQLARGLPFANSLLEARTAFQQDDLAQAAETIAQAIELHERRVGNKERRQRHAAAGNPTSDRQRHLEKEKQEKYRKLSAGLERLHSALVKRQTSHAGPDEQEGGDVQEDSSPSGSGREQTDVDQAAKQESGLGPLNAPEEFDEQLYVPRWLLEGFEGAASGESQIELVRDYFRAQPIRSKYDLEVNGIYLLRTKVNNHLVRITGIHPVADTVELAFVGKQSGARPQALSKLIKEGKKRRLVRLIPRLLAKQAVDEAGSIKPSDTTSAAESPQVSPPSATANSATETGNREHDCVLEMGAFTQLVDAAQRCGLVPSPDLIAHVRDREFRKGNYQKAFEIIEGMFGKFSSAAMAREQRLRREDVDIASGRTNLNPREIQAKRVRDNADSQRISRARSRFSRVLEGLRVIIAREKKQNQAEDGSQ